MVTDVCLLGNNNSEYFTGKKFLGYEKLYLKMKTKLDPVSSRKIYLETQILEIVFFYELQILLCNQKYGPVFRDKFCKFRNAIML